MATQCPEVPKGQPYTDAPPCHAGKVLNDGMLHKCSIGRPDHPGKHHCYCYPEGSKEWE